MEATMSPSNASAIVLAPDLSEALALTASDRRLKSIVLLHLARSGNGAGRHGPLEEPAATRRPEPGDDPDDPDEARVLGHAVRIAESLAGEYGPAAPNQKRLIAELAVEMALRIEDQLAGLRCESAIEGAA
jgi:hypothetical protein